jgi:hypothetical protein
MRTYSQRIGKLIKGKRWTMYNQLQIIGLPLCSKINPALAVSLLSVDLFAWEIAFGEKI